MRWRIVSQKPSPEPKDGNQPSCTAKRAMKPTAATKDGMAPKAVSVTTTVRSTQVPRLTAARMPAARPKTVMSRPAMITRPRVTGRRSSSTSETDWRYCMERPKSPVKIPPIHLRYCSHGERFRPYCSVTAAMASGLGLRPRSRKESGSPGTRKREKKTSRDAGKSVRTRPASFPPTERTMFTRDSSFWCRLSARPGPRPRVRT